jgi:alpha-N-arabinofuranosidase
VRKISRTAAIIGSLLALALGAGSPVLADTPETAQVTVHVDRPGPVMRPELQGQFAEELGHGVYGGLWVGEDSSIPNIHGYRKDVVEALKAIKVPVVRWPGGCFADGYHWRDGVGPRAKRPVRLNMNWGGVEEPNSFGTDEFMNFAELIGAKTYISADVGSGTAGEMSDWIEYITSDSHSTLAEQRRANGRDKPWTLDYLGVGNEAWGCGGNMRPDYYANLLRQYATFVWSPADHPIVKVASGANSEDVQWTDTVMANAAGSIDAISLHAYTIPTSQWEHKGSATDFGEDQWMSTLKGALRMEQLIIAHGAAMDKYDPGKRIGLFVDEWGNWYDAEPGTNGAFLYQQNSLRDAITAALNLNIFQAHADRVRMANIAQMVNVLQAMILTDKDRMVRTPTYWVYDLYQVFQGATALPVEVTGPDYVLGAAAGPAVHASAGRDAKGTVWVALVNVDPHHAVTVTAKMAGLTAKSVSGQVITAPAINSVNSFDHPDVVVPSPFSGASLSGDMLTATLPPKSVVVLGLR